MSLLLVVYMEACELNIFFYKGSHSNASTARCEEGMLAVVNWNPCALSPGETLLIFDQSVIWGKIKAQSSQILQVIKRRQTNVCKTFPNF